jgi:hypothetical protein
MDLSRRQFVGLLGVSRVAFSTPAARGEPIVERRVYDHASVIPPESVLKRCGLHRFRRYDGPERVTFLVRFASTGERARAWDRFNTDPEWCRLRAGGDVRLKELSFPS